MEPKRLKETDNVLVRVPAALRELAAKEASGQNISQNAFITNSLLFGVLVFGERKYVGKPKNVQALVREIDRAHKENDAAVGAFNSQDWAEIEYLARMLESSEVIANLKLRQDTQAKDTTVFTFTLTKNGRLAWPHLRDALIMVSSIGQEPLPLG